MNEPRRPGGSKPPEGLHAGGETVRKEGEDPPELQLLLRPLGNNLALRERMSRAYYRVMEGAPHSISVQFAILISGLVAAAQPAPSGPAGKTPGPNGTGPWHPEPMSFTPQAGRDAQAALDRQTDEILRAIRAAQPPVRWWQRWEWLAALCASLLLAGFAFGYWLTWDWAKAQASADANARVEALTAQLPQAERFSLLIQGFGGNVRWFNPPSPEGKPRALTLAVSTGRFKVEELKANDARNEVSFTVR